jgi:hypothetical protein
LCYPKKGGWAVAIVATAAAARADGMYSPKPSVGMFFED